MNEKSNDNEFKIKDLITFLKAEEGKAKAMYRGEKHFEELGQKRERAFRQIRERLELHYPEIVPGEEGGITLSKKSVSDFADVVKGFDKHLKEKGLGDEMKCDYVVEILNEEKERCRRQLCPADSWMFTVAERKRYRGNLAQLESVLKMIDKGWLPTAENINALPDPIRGYIHDLKTNADPAGMVQENVLVKDLCKQLEAKLALQQPEIDKKYVESKAKEIESTIRYPSTSIHTIVDRVRVIKRVITQIIKDARGLQVPVVKIKKMPNLKDCDFLGKKEEIQDLEEIRKQEEEE